MKTRPLWVDLTIEIAVGVLGLHILVLAVFRRYSFGPITATSPTMALLLCVLLLALRVWLNRTRPRQQPRGFARMRPGNWAADLGVPGLIVACCFFVVFFVFHHYGGWFGSDGVMNYIYVRSLVLDGDLDLTNEFEDFVPQKYQHIAAVARSLGKPPNPLNEPGPALFWAPAFIVAHLSVHMANALGADIPVDGYSYPYINAVCVSGFLWGFVAVVISYRVACRYFEPHLAAVSVSAAWLTTTLYWYTVMEPSMPHATAAAAVSVFLYLWLAARERPTLGRWVAVALAGGMIVSMQRYNAFFFLAPLLTGAGWLWAQVKKPNRKDFSKLLVFASTLAAAIFLTASPMLLYNLSHSRESSMLRIGVNTFRYWSNPKIAEFLFSSNHGLFSWTPVAGLAVLGLLVLLRKDRRLAAILILTLAGGIYLLSSTWDWYAGYAFGSRRMTEAFLIFALGFCGFMELVLRRPKIVIFAVSAALVTWNLLLAGQVKRGEVPMMGTFAFSDTASRAVKRLYELGGHPPSFPASWMFRWKYGTRPDQFDPIFGHREYHNLAIDVGTDDDRYFLGHGWSVAEPQPDGTAFRWSLGEESTWLVPLFGPFDYQLRLTAEPARHPEGRRQVVSVEVNGARAAAATLTEGWQTVETRVPASFWKEGLNEIRLRYGFTVEAGAVYGSSDPRHIALRLSRLELQIIKPLP